MQKKQVTQRILSRNWARQNLLICELKLSHAQNSPSDNVYPVYLHTLPNTWKHFFLTKNLVLKTSNTQSYPIPVPGTTWHGPGLFSSQECLALTVVTMQAFYQPIRGGDDGTKYNRRIRVGDDFTTTSVHGVHTPRPVL